MTDERKRTRSWREIDRKKDRSDHRQEQPTGGGPHGPKGGAARSRSHRSALDQLFNSGKIADLIKKKDAETGVEAKAAGPSRQQLTKALEKATSRDEKVKAIDTYLEAYALPPDYDILTHVLEHSDKDVVADALSKIEDLLEIEKPRRARSLTAQLRNISELSEYGSLRKHAGRVLEKL